MFKYHNLRGLLSAALLALGALVSMPAAAQTAGSPAIPGEVSEEDYVSTVYTSEMVQRLVNGEEVRVESRNKRNGFIYRWDGMTRTLVRWTYMRPHGHAENTWSQFYYCTDGNARVIGGNSCAPAFADMSKTLNGNASFGRSMAAGIGGILPAVAGPIAGNLTSPCRNGGCNSSPGVINVVEGATAVAGAVSESNTATNTTVDVRMGAACATYGVCGGSTPTAANDNGYVHPAAVANE